MQITLNADTSIGVAARSGAATAFCLGGGMVVGAAAGFLIGELSPAAAVAVALLILAGAGVLWGRLMAEITRSPERSRMMVAGAIAFGLGIISAAFGLSALEAPFLEQGIMPDLPIHVVYGRVFVPAASLVAGLGGLALGIAQRRGRRAFLAALLASVAAGLAYLAAYLLMDAIGYRVGAPGAEERATMITVTFIGSIAGALAGGAAVGLSLRRPAEDITSAAE